MHQRGVGGLSPPLLRSLEVGLFGFTRSDYRTLTLCKTSSDVPSPPHRRPGFGGYILVKFSCGNVSLKTSPFNYSSFFSRDLLNRVIIDFVLNFFIFLSIILSFLNLYKFSFFFFLLIFSFLLLVSS